MRDDEKRGYIGCLVIIAVLVLLTRSCSCQTSEKSDAISSDNPLPPDAKSFDVPLELVGEQNIIEQLIEKVMERKQKTDPAHAIAPRTLKLQPIRGWSM